MEEIAKTVIVVRSFLNYYVDNLMDITIVEEFQNLKNSAKNALRDERGINKMLDDIERRLRVHIDENTKQQIYQAGLRAPVLRFERETFEGIWDRIKKGIGKINPKEWLLTLWKALNIIINSLIAIFPELEVVKEFKEHLENLTDKEDRAGKSYMPISG